MLMSYRCHHHRLPSKSIRALLWHVSTLWNANTRLFYIHFWSPMRIFALYFFFSSFYVVRAHMLPDIIRILFLPFLFQQGSLFCLHTKLTSGTLSKYNFAIIMYYRSNQSSFRTTWNKKNCFRFSPRIHCSIEVLNVMFLFPFFQSDIFGSLNDSGLLCRASEAALVSSDCKNASTTLLSH